jgi:hypothetical protein
MSSGQSACYFHRGVSSPARRARRRLSLFAALTQGDFLSCAVCTPAPPQKRPVLVRTGGDGLKIFPPCSARFHESKVLGLREKLAEFVHPVPAHVRTLAVPDLVDGKIIRDEHAAVSLVPTF